MRRSLRSTFALCALAALYHTIGCAGAPVPTVARAGTTIGIASNDPLAATLGYATNDHADPQRGATIFELTGPDPLTDVYYAPTRMITRTYPDPSSPAGLTGVASGVPLTGALQQTLALLDIPSTVPPGDYTISARRTEEPDPTSQQISDAPAAEGPYWQIEILPYVEPAFTPLEGFNLPLTPSVLDQFVPHPKVLFALPTTPTAAAAATLEISFDNSRVLVLGAHVDELVSQDALVTVEYISPDTVRIHYVNPNPGNSADNLAIVFAHLVSANYDPLDASDPNDFDYVSGSFYDEDGVQFTPTDDPDLWVIR